MGHAVADPGSGGGSVPRPHSRTCSWSRSTCRKAETVGVTKYRKYHDNFAHSQITELSPYYRTNWSVTHFHHFIVREMGWLHIFPHKRLWCWSSVPQNIDMQISISSVSSRPEYIKPIEYRTGNMACGIWTARTIPSSPISWSIEKADKLSTWSAYELKKCSISSLKLFVLLLGFYGNCWIK